MCDPVPPRPAQRSSRCACLIIVAGDDLQFAVRAPEASLPKPPASLDGFARTLLGRSDGSFFGLLRRRVGNCSFVTLGQIKCKLAFSLQWQCRQGHSHSRSFSISAALCQAFAPDLTIQAQETGETSTSRHCRLPLERTSCFAASNLRSCSRIISTGSVPWHLLRVALDCFDPSTPAVLLPARLDTSSSSTSCVSSALVAAEHPVASFGLPCRPLWCSRSSSSSAG